MALNIDFFEDTLELQGVSTELLELWGERQEQLNAAITRSHCKRLPTSVRTDCLSFTSSLMKMLRLSEKSWFEAAAIFDFYCVKSDLAEGELIARAPAVCTAIARICAKRDCERMGRSEVTFSEFACRLVRDLGELGYEVDECSEKSLDEAEIEILTVLDWNLHILSLEMWTSFLHKRLDVLTRGMFKYMLDWASKWSTGIARMVVLTTSFGDGALCARRMAEGIVASSLIFAGLLPERVLRPQAMRHSEAEWLDLLRSCTPARALPDCNIEGSRANLLLHILTVVTGNDVESIRESCAVACGVARDNVLAWRQQLVSGTRA